MLINSVLNNMIFLSARVHSKVTTWKRQFSLNFKDGGTMPVHFPLAVKQSWLNQATPFSNKQNPSQDKEKHVVCTWEALENSTKRTEKVIFSKMWLIHSMLVDVCSTEHLASAPEHLMHIVAIAAITVWFEPPLNQHPNFSSWESRIVILNLHLPAPALPPKIQANLNMHPRPDNPTSVFLNMFV